jgi:hypothetical protein
MRRFLLLRRTCRPILAQVLHLLRTQRTSWIGCLDRLLLLVEAWPRLGRNCLVE